ncbi:carbohydrate porin [Alteromonas sp. MmMcT2-2]|uniref:carbohydrate porin n=1 Tax=Alteromonas sp. MmMcT2-2 TaxID=2917732 RepID=UPI001EF2A9D0|nr:carbohydrate porin [Alteromonas sp. MmMcT2-2]
MMKTPTVTRRFSGCKIGLQIALLASAAIVAATASASQSKFQDAFDFQASYTGESATNIDGGERRGSAYAGQLFVGGELDLNTLAGWKDTKIYIAMTNRHGKNLAEHYIGNSTSVQEIFGGQNTRLARFTISSSFLDGDLELEGGRTVANISFLGSELCQYFQTNAACGNPTFVFRTSNFTWWPVSSWGGHAKYWLSQKTYFHTGVYEDNTSHQDLGDHGFDWATNEATGVVVPFTLGYQTTWDNDELPRRYEIGGWYDGADYTDPVFDEDGNYAAQSGNDYAVRNGRSGIFARFEQTVTRPNPLTKEGLTLFGAVLTGTSGELIEDYYIKAGFVLRGTLASRPDDTIGFVFTRQQYSDEALEDQRILRNINGGVGTPASSQTMLELSYGYQLNDHVRIQPNVHYIINPDQFAQRDRVMALDDAIVLGLRFDVNLAALIL